MLKIEVQQFNSSVSSLWNNSESHLCARNSSMTWPRRCCVPRHFFWENNLGNLYLPELPVIKRGNRKSIMDGFPIKTLHWNCGFSSYDWWHCRAHGEKHPIFSHFGGTKSSKCLVLQRDTNGEESNQNKSVPFPTHIELKMILIAQACTPN